MLNAILRGSILLAAIGGARGGVRAADTILGLPAPREASRPGAVMLHGGGRVTNEAFTRFVELAGGKDARIVLVPSAGYRLADYDSKQQFADAMKRRFGSWFGLVPAGRARNVEFLSSDDPDDADSEAFVRPLESATGVWFGGGDQSRLNYRYVGHFPRQSRFQAALRGVLTRGGTVGGTSAGMAALPEIMTMYQDRQRANGPLSVAAAHGLGLFNGAIVVQHFDGRSGRLERFTGLLRDSTRLDKLAGRRGAGMRMLGLAVEESTALVLQSDQLETLGAGNGHVFIKSGDDRTVIWHTLKTGDKALLKRDTTGSVMLAGGR